MAWSDCNAGLLLRSFSSLPKTLSQRLISMTLRAMAETPLRWSHSACEFIEYQVADLLKWYCQYKASEHLFNVLKASLKKVCLPDDLKKCEKRVRKRIELESTKEVLSWCMPNAKTECVTMTAFLKSSERTILVKDRFRGISDADLFRIEGEGFSVDYNASMVNQSAQVEVTKNRFIFDSENGALKKSRMILELLEHL